MKQLISKAKSLKRETIFIFTSDNGAITWFNWSWTSGQRERTGCNYPYKGQSLLVIFSPNQGSQDRTRTGKYWKISDRKLSLVLKFSFRFGDRNSGHKVIFKKGIKSDLTEGGTKVPTFVYSTKRKFAKEKSFSRYRVIKRIKRFTCERNVLFHWSKINFKSENLLI